LLGAQLEAIGCGILLDARNALGSGNRSDVVALHQQPRDRYLRRSCPDLGGDGLDLRNYAKVVLEVLSGEARVGLAPVVVASIRAIATCLLRSGGRAASIGAPAANHAQRR
jgi:hypothetical protein